MKRLLALLLVLVGGLALVGCNKGPVELKTVSMFGGTDANKDVYNSIIRIVEAKGDVVIKDNSTTSDEEWKASVISDFSTGNEPHVLHFFTGSTAAPLVDNDKVVSIEEIRKEYPDYAKNINASVLGTHSVPTTGFVEGIFTNKDHFSTPELKALLAKDSFTWAEFKTVLGQLVAANSHIAGYKPIAYGMDIPHYWLDHIVAAELGVDYYEEITKAGGEDKMLSALTKLSKIQQYFSQDEEYALSEQGFFDGKYSMILDGSWFAGRVELKNATALPFPILNETHGSPILAGFTSGFYITRKAWNNKQTREAAVNFVQAMTSTDSLKLFASNGGFAADDKATPAAITPLNAELAKLVNRTDYQVLPLGDASAAGTYAGLVTAQASFILNQEAAARAAVKAYLSGQ